MGVRTTEEARELAASLHLNSAKEAMREHARALLERSGITTVPVPLHALFPWAGVRKVRREETLVEGALQRVDGGLLDIIVRADRSATRQRFSIAHEIGHVIFHKFAPNSKAAQARMGQYAPPEEERLCNVAAEELLMPAWFVERTIGGHDEPAAAAIALATACDVSIETAVIRVASMWQHSRGVLELWERQSSTWKRKWPRPRRLGRLPFKIDEFEVEGWRGCFIADIASLPWSSPEQLYLKNNRTLIPVVSAARRFGARSVVVSHVLSENPGAAQENSLANARRDRVRKAIASPPCTDCERCSGTGWIEQRAIGGDSRARLAPVAICACRYDRALSAS
jgi:hypothetical protein